ncbi:hydrolase [Nocardioides psychrotolerans]|uniref:Nicotinamidase-related amidase n=1 Tax=Nocardioides psychrotolerans TaxID=1005945 RepID=A0A1I3FPK1_9ACTN|nr:isochorismatase family cysteine hydrolase [Nocardioides psychrotolerans]GEP37245.1 hydrolase [Nocardioides psychrotolerans]SFI13175.1 Nicotinamidase-related amidase [Nocardioides psychrotolerans]
MTGRLHAWHIEEREYSRQEQRRGRRHAYEWLDPRRTALVVVDVVDFFVEANDYCRGIVPQVNALATALRSAGGTVAWVLPSTRLQVSEDFYGPEVARLYDASGGQGAMADRLWSGLDAETTDLWVEKTAPSAFFPGHSPLPGLLEERDIDTVLLTGTVTNVCVESTARDASTLGYRVVVVADGCAAMRDQDHNATLHTLYRSFGDVRPTTEVLALIEAGAVAKGLSRP